MVTYFNKKDLVSFGNYLLSKERRELFKSRPKPINSEGPGLTLDERLSVVHHADVENWMELEKNKKSEG